MVIVGIVLWIIGALMVLIGGLAFLGDEEIHRDDIFKKYYESWGGVRFYTLAVLFVILVAALWPLVLGTLWIVALVKGW